MQFDTEVQIDGNFYCNVIVLAKKTKHYLINGRLLGKAKSKMACFTVNAMTFF